MSGLMKKLGAKNLARLSLKEILTKLFFEGAENVGKKFHFCFETPFLPVVMQYTDFVLANKPGLQTD